MKVIDNWEDIKGTEFVENNRLTVGGHKCIIKDVINYAHNGIEKVSLQVDILDDEFKDFYQKKYDERPDNAKFWDDGATISFPAEPKEDKDKSYIKGFIKAIESYNDGYKWDWDEKKLKGKVFNGNFSLKEYNGNDGKVYTKPQINRFVNSKENYNEKYVPSVRTIDNTFIKYENYIEQHKNDNSTSNSDPFADFGDTVEIDENFLD